MPDKVTENIANHLGQLDVNRKRALKESQILPAGRLIRQGRTFLDFASNDYLGLAHHPGLSARSTAFTAQYGNGSGASRLVSGSAPFFDQIERKIAAMKGTQTALVLNSGFQANASILSTLLGHKAASPQKTLLFTDKLNHASLHAGAQLSGVSQIRYRHNDLSHLKELLDKHCAKDHASFIVTESVFSMDGDILDVDAITELSQHYGCYLYVDEAHATGVMGNKGSGLCKGDKVQAIMGTFGKALGSFGAYFACSHEIREYLINHCPGFIYATALPPAVLGAVDAALDLLPALDEERARLKAYGERVRLHLSELGFDYMNSASQIIPVIIGQDEDVLRAGEVMEDHGLICGIIRPPTVPANTARLRICLSSAHSKSDIETLTQALSAVAGVLKK